MPIQILNRSFFNPLTGEATGFYKANAGDKITCTFTILETIYVMCDSYNYIYDYFNFTITSSIFNFRQEGFLVGDFVKCTKINANGTTGNSFQTTVVSVNNSQIRIGHQIPNIATGEYFIIEQNASLPLRQELHLFVNHKQASTNLYDQFSHIDGEATTLQCLNMPSVTNANPGIMSQFGNRSGQWEIGLRNIVKGEGANTARQYVIQFTVIQSGIYQDTLFTAADCLNLSIGFRMFRLSGDINTATTIFDDYASNTGRFNEGYNDEPVFTVVSQLLPTLFYNGSTTASFVISGATSNLAGIGASYLPINAAYYKNKTTSQTELGMTIETSQAVALNTYTGENQSDPLNPLYDITINSISFVGGVITCNITFNPNFNSFLNNKPLDRRFIIWAKVGNVNHIVFDGQLKLKAQLPVPFTPTLLEVVDFRANNLVPSSNTINNLTIEDNASLRAIIPMLQNEVLSSLNIRLISKNIGTGDFFVLQSDSFNMNGSPYFSGAYIGSQIINKNYNLASGSVKNVSHLQPTPLVGVNYSLVLNYPFLVRWEYWISKLNAPFDFFGNQNEKWINYQNSVWKIFIEVQKNYVGQPLEFTERQLLVNDYDSDINVIVHNIILKRLNGSVINNVIDEPLTITVNTTATGVITQEEIELTIEPKEGSPRWHLTTFYQNNNSNNPITQISSVTTGSSNVSVFSLDTSKLDISNGVSITAQIKGLAISEPIFNRTKETFNYVKLPSAQEESEYKYGCCVEELKLASLSSNKKDHNDVVGVYTFIGNDNDEVFARLYKNDNVLETVNLKRLPEDVLSRMHVFSCKDWLLEYGAGCYELRISGDVGGISFEYVYGKYRLLPYSSVTSRNQFRLRCYNDKYASNEKVNFAESGYYDDIRLGGRFGQMQPKTVVDNLIYHDRVTRSIINENIPEYTMDSNKVNPLMITKLVKMILQSTNIEASDYNRYAPDFIRNIEVILPKEGQGLLLEYLALTQDRVVSCQFRKKTLNERVFTK